MHVSFTETLELLKRAVRISGAHVCKFLLSFGDVLLVDSACFSGSNGFRSCKTVFFLSNIFSSAEMLANTVN